MQATVPSISKRQEKKGKGRSAADKAALATYASMLGAFVGLVGYLTAVCSHVH